MSMSALVAALLILQGVPSGVVDGFCEAAGVEGEIDLGHWGQLSLLAINIPETQNPWHYLIDGWQFAYVGNCSAERGWLGAFPLLLFETGEIRIGVPSQSFNGVTLKIEASATVCSVVCAHGVFHGVLIGRNP